ncbi:MAG: hypothetical protein ABIH42_10965, partial [Planctomycetota bacterium]
MDNNINIIETLLAVELYLAKGGLFADINFLCNIFLSSELGHPVSIASCRPAVVHRPFVVKFDVFAGLAVNESLSHTSSGS